MMSLSVEKKSKVIEAFSLTSRHLDDLLNIDNKYFDGLISQLFPSNLQLNKANSSETKAPFLDLHLSRFISCKINAMILILRSPIFVTWMRMFLVGHPTVFISRNLFDSPECLVMFLSSTLEINC